MSFALIFIESAFLIPRGVEHALAAPVLTNTIFTTSNLEILVVAIINFPELRVLSKKLIFFNSRFANYLG